MRASLSVRLRVAALVTLPTHHSNILRPTHQDAMDSPTATRRRRRRRVPDENRKRAPRACTYCKTRKSKCIETTRGICQRCLQSDLICEFERQRSIDERDVGLPLEAQISPSARNTVPRHGSYTDSAAFDIATSPTSETYPRLSSQSPRSRSRFSTTSCCTLSSLRMQRTWHRFLPLL